MEELNTTGSLIENESIIDVAILFNIGLALLILLAILLFFLFFPFKKKKISSPEKPLEIKTKDFDELLKIIKDKQTDTQDLKEASKLILRDYGSIHDFSIYLDIIYKITLHPNTNKNIIIHFDKELSRLNPKYKEQIGKSVVNALNSKKKK